MSDERINELISEWLEPRPTEPLETAISPKVVWYWNDDDCMSSKSEWSCLRNFCLSLDDCAVFEAEVERQNCPYGYTRQLTWVLNADPHQRYNLAWRAVTATPLQRCEALLRMLGKWEES